MYFFEKGKKIFKSSEEIISMFLGLAIVVVIVGLVFSFFQKKKGDITIPGVSNNNDSQLQIKGDDGKNTATNGNNSSEYTVAAGDNLWKIAQAKYNNGDAWTKIAQANNLKNPRVIRAGQKLTIPQLEDTKIASKTTKDNTSPTSITKPSTSNSSEYTVVRNDNLWKIAVKTYGDGYKWVQIWDANKSSLKNPSIIHSGNKLILPNLKS